MVSRYVTRTHMHAHACTHARVHRLGSNAHVHHHNLCTHTLAFPSRLPHSGECVGVTPRNQHRGYECEPCSINNSHGTREEDVDSLDPVAALLRERGSEKEKMMMEVRAR